MRDVGRLDDLDLSQRLGSAEEQLELAALGARLSQLRLALGGKLGDSGIGPGLLILFEGWDASGKGGAIKRLVAPLDARHVRVVQYAAPTADEKRHHHLQRFQVQLPGLGGMGILDRTWYGRVLVERVEGFATQDQWERAYGEIVNFERSLFLEGIILVKFWLHISQDEQLRRFKRRQKDQLKAWKLTDEDWRNRERHAEYVAAVEEMLERTDTHWAPWRVVAAEDKRSARVEVVRHVIAEIERGCTHVGFPLPEPLG